MTLTEWFAKRDADWAARTRVEQHGTAQLTLLDDLPLRAIGCTLPDGALTDAECLIPGTTASTDAERVWTRRLSGTALRRRGRVAVEPGTTLRFGDEPAADGPIPSGQVESQPPDLQRDLDASARIRALVCGSAWKIDPLRG